MVCGTYRVVASKLNIPRVLVIGQSTWDLRKEEVLHVWHLHQKQDWERIYVRQHGWVT